MVYLGHTSCRREGLVRRKRWLVLIVLAVKQAADSRAAALGPTIRYGEVAIRCASPAAPIGQAPCRLPSVRGRRICERGTVP